MVNIQKGINDVYENKIYKVRLTKDRIYVKRNEGTLKIIFAKDYLIENEGTDIVRDIFNYIVSLFINKDIVLKISGKNKITLTKDTFSLQGSIRFENVKLHNPILYNVELLNVDFSKSREAAIGFSTVKNCVNINTMALKILYTNVTNQDYFNKLIKKLELSGN